MIFSASPYSARSRSILLALAGVLALAGCHHGAKNDDQRTAGGEVLSGSISDAMLPYDTVKSQPPLAPGRAASDAGSAESAASGDAVAGPVLTADPVN